MKRRLETEITVTPGQLGFFNVLKITGTGLRTANGGHTMVYPILSQTGHALFVRHFIETSDVLA